MTRPRNRSFVTAEALRMALENVRAHKLRSFLTVVGVVIGVSVVIVISSILTGMRKNIVQSIEEYGTNNIFAFHLTTGPRFGPATAPSTGASRCAPRMARPSRPRPPWSRTSPIRPACGSPATTPSTSRATSSAIPRSTG
jgi:hypothetical protein